MKVGNTVRLKGKKTTAIILKLVADPQGGVLLDRPLDDFRWWNVEDLEVAE